MQKSKNKTLVDSLVIGAALFAMFFGAGNMIFPPYLGFKAGTQWLSGFLGYYIADIGLAIVAILAQIKTGGYKGIFAPLGQCGENGNNAEHCALHRAAYQHSQNCGNYL